MKEKEGFIIRDQSKAHFITATVVDWVDVFSRKTYKDCVIESQDFCIKNKGMILYGFVIMSNHIHLIIQSENSKLSDLIRDFKKFTAKTILNKIETEPESRTDWMLKPLNLLAKAIAEMKNISFGNMEIIPKKFFQKSSFGRKWIIFI